MLTKTQKTIGSTSAVAKPADNVTSEALKAAAARAKAALADTDAAISAAEESEQREKERRLRVYNERMGKITLKKPEVSKSSAQTTDEEFLNSLRKSIKRICVC